LRVIYNDRTGQNDQMKECNQCGKCCTIYADGGLSASDSEIAWWEDNRPDIASYVGGGKIWISPVTGKQMPRCPWLRKLPNQKKYVCRIYFDRPDDCRYYPVRIEDMIRDGCEMIEPRDLRYLEQGQRTLDKIMADSRPPMSEE